MRPCLKYCIQFLEPKHKDLLEQIQKRATKDPKGLEQISCEDRLREFELFSHEKRRLLEDSRPSSISRWLSGKLERDFLSETVVIGQVMAIN